MKKNIIFLFVALSFFIGVLFGTVFTEKKVTELENSYYTLELNLKTFELQYLFTATFNKNFSCSFLGSELNLILKDIDDFIFQLESNKKTSKELEKKYMLAVARHWLLIENIKKDCNKSLTTVLYFHTPEKEPNFGYCLSEIKSLSPSDFLVFPLRTDLDIPIINALQEVYNIKTVPAIIINNSIKYEGLINESGLKEFCCERKNISGIC